MTRACLSCAFNSSPASSITRSANASAYCTIKSLFISSRDWGATFDEGRFVQFGVTGATSERLENRQGAAAAHLDIDAPPMFFAMQARTGTRFPFAVEVFLADNDLPNGIFHDRNSRPEHLVIYQTTHCQHGIAENFRFDAADRLPCVEPIVRIDGVEMIGASRNLLVGT